MQLRCFGVPFFIAELMVVLICLNYEHIVLNTKILLFLLSTNNFIVFLFVYSKDTRKGWNNSCSWVLKKIPAILQTMCSWVLKKISAILSIPLQTMCSWVLKKAPAILSVQSRCVVVGTQKDTRKVVELFAFVGT